MKRKSKSINKLNIKKEKKVEDKYLSIQNKKNNIVYIRNENARKRMLKPSGSNFNLIQPEIGVFIEDKSRKKKEVKTKKKI